MHARGREPMTKEQAAEELKETHYFDYLHGRVIKVKIEGDQLNPRLYDRDNGEGAAQHAIESIRA